MSGKGATALTESQLIDKLCDAVIAKLAERGSGPLPSKQWVVSSSLTRDASNLAGATALLPQGNCRRCSHDVALRRRAALPNPLGGECEDSDVAALSDSLTSCRILVWSEGRSPSAIR